MVGVVEQGMRERAWMQHLKGMTFITQVVCFLSFTPDSPTKETVHNMENTHKLIWVSPEQ